MKVLFGIGGLEVGFDALETTIGRTRETGDDLTVAVIDREDVADDPEEIARRVRERFSETGLAADVRVIEGHPGSRLVELAEREGFDRLVLAGGERSPLGKIQLGETLEFVLLNAETTVTLVR